MKKQPTSVVIAVSAESALNQIRDWLKQGATIRATDPRGRVLEFLPDGTIHGGLIIDGKPNNLDYQQADIRISSSV